MERVEEFLENNKILDADNIDALLKLSDYVRDLIKIVEFSQISELIKYVIENKAFETLSWIFSILEETYENKDNSEGIADFLHDLGRKIENYDEIIEFLGVTDSVYDSTTKFVLDNHGEVDSFFNISIYKTKYANGYLIGAENFDVKDNDFIQYKLLFTEDIGKYIKS